MSKSLYLSEDELCTWIRKAEPVREYVYKLIFMDDSEYIFATIPKMKLISIHHTPGFADRVYMPTLETIWEAHMSEWLDRSKENVG